MIAVTDLRRGQRLQLTARMGRFTENQFVNVLEAVWLFSRGAYSVTLGSSMEDATEHFWLDRDDEIPAIETF